MTPVATILKVIEVGHSLSRQGASIQLRANGTPAPDLVYELRSQKAALLEILGSQILIVRSRHEPERPMFWCGSENERDLLINHGAPEGQVWIRDELAEVVKGDPSPDSLRLMIQSKRMFGARITGD